MAKLNFLEMGAKFQDFIVESVCKGCGELQSACLCGKKEILKSRESYLIWVNEEKVSGKDITRCGIFYENLEVMQVFLKQIKKKCASGGSLERKNQGILLSIQGKHQDTLKQFFKNNGFQFKK